MYSFLPFKPLLKEIRKLLIPRILGFPYSLNRGIRVNGKIIK